LRLLQQTLGLHRRFDRVEHDTDARGELLEEGEVRLGEVVQRGDADHRLDLTLEDHREDHQIAWQRLEEDRTDRHAVARDVGHQQAPHVPRALSDEPFADGESGGEWMVGQLGVTGEHLQIGHRLGVHLIDDALMGGDERHQLRKQQLSHGGENARGPRDTSADNSSLPTVARSRWPWSMPVKRARFVFSQSCSVLRSVVNRRLSIIVLMLSLSSATSPRASTLIDRVRSPLVTAVATSAIERPCVVRFAARRFTLPVRSFHVPAAPGTLAWPPRRPSTPTSRATFVTWSAKIASVFVMSLIVSASAATSPFDCTNRFCLRLPSAPAVTTLRVPRTRPG